MTTVTEPVAADQPVTAPSSGVREALGEVRDLDEGKREALLEIPWEVLDTYRSDFSRECFDDYLNGRLPVMCWQHDKTEPIGRAQSWQKGQRANEFVTKFSDFGAVPRAHQAFVQMRDGDITDVSFYYDQATAIRHPNVRGAVRFTKARMPEISPVTVGSIPGAKVAGVRATADATGLADLVRTGVIDEQEARAMLAEQGAPIDRERIVIPTVRTAAEPGETTAVEPTFTLDEDGLRCARAVDASVAQAYLALTDIDVDSLPEGVRDAVGYVVAASVAAEQMRDALGLPAPELGDRATGEKPYGDVKYADNGLQDDGKKRYPLDTEEHVRAAWSYINQEANAGKYSTGDLAKVKNAIKAAADKLGVEISDDGARAAADDIEADALYADAMTTLTLRRGDASPKG